MQKNVFFSKKSWPDGIHPRRYTLYIYWNGRRQVLISLLFYNICPWNSGICEIYKYIIRKYKLDCKKTCFSQKKVDRTVFTLADIRYIYIQLVDDKCWYLFCFTIFYHEIQESVRIINIGYDNINFIVKKKVCLQKKLTGRCSHSPMYALIILNWYK